MACHVSPPVVHELDSLDTARPPPSQLLHNMPHASFHTRLATLAHVMHDIIPYHAFTLSATDADALIKRAHVVSHVMRMTHHDTCDDMIARVDATWQTYASTADTATRHSYMYKQLLLVSPRTHHHYPMLHGHR